MPRKTFRVASYNIRKARGLDFKRDPGRTLEVINGLEADVVLLQEADRRLGPRKAALPRDLIETHSDFTVAPIGQSDVSLGWHGNAVLMRQGLRMERAERLTLPGLEPRGAVRVDLGGTASLSVLATHLGLRRKDRQGQQDVILNALGDDLPCVLAGDLNEWSATRGLDRFAKRFDMLAPGRSFHARRPIAALDRIGLTGGVTLFDAGVDDGPLASRASDHLPIWADVHLPEAAP